MDRESWVIAFVEALQALRPHTPIKLATAIARGCYVAAVEPAAAARAWHQKQGGAPAPRKRKP